MNPDQILMAFRLQATLKDVRMDPRVARPRIVLCLDAASPTGRRSIPGVLALDFRLDARAVLALSSFVY
jgi:hypothetical protein